MGSRGLVGVNEKWKFRWTAGKDTEHRLEPPYAIVAAGYDNEARSRGACCPKIHGSLTKCKSHSL